MDNLNQTVPTFIEYRAMSGIRIHITPINGLVVKAFQEKAKTIYPYPDPTPYEKPMANAVEGVMAPATDNDDYKELMKEADKARNNWANHAILDYTLTFPDFPTREALIDYFAPQREKLKELGADLPDDKWILTLDYCILSGDRNTRNDFVQVINTSVQALPLTEEEILEGIRFFRLKV